MIGSSCRLYKKCKVCGETKYWKLFESNGERRRKSYCRDCKGRRHELFHSELPKYNFDTQTLKKSDIDVRLKLRSNRKIQYTVTYEQAILMVNEGAAGIVHETLIHKFYDRETFKSMILKRDQNVCAYCGEYGDTVDHIKSKSEGGISSPVNCICACQKCNMNKGSLPLEEFLFYIEPIEVSGNVQDGRLEQQLHYLIQSLEYLNGRINSEGFSEEHTFERINQTIEQVEKTLGRLKTNMLEMSELGRTVI